jgi:uncharacterized protein with PQ loop repeat
MDFLDFVPVAMFEGMGIFAGLSACFVVLVQVLKEYRSNDPSSLTNIFLFGWLLIYLFWCFYGIRFDAIAMWFTNGIAFTLQVLLCVVVIRKRIAS